ncbi:MAG TPA: chromate transporter [Peptococcaceae bacterium]|mgnify:CR=1 FL=1|jgi:chromate transporter|nr:chromate transporter [Clostridia bacterium]HOB81365.1 chromate transporter [Peptococcaceae bacterium]HPZ71536.1 chromate transporter [Peptococcaceae bacterium]HQD54549.1 chromate transporter [Peptococcaceae bacterium]
MLWLLFKSFFLIGALGFGGGYAMLSLIQKEVVTKHAWLTMLQFADILAVAEMTPGPVAINTATYVGYQTAGIVGAAVATCGVVLPSFLLISILTGLLLQNKNSPYFKGAFLGLRPIVVALIVDAALLLSRDVTANLYGFLLFLFVLGLSLWTKLHPILLILGAGLLSVLFPVF